MSNEERHHEVPSELQALSRHLRPMEAPGRVEAALIVAHRRLHSRSTPWLAAWRLLVPAALAGLAVLALLPKPEAPAPATSIASREIATDYLPVGLGPRLGGNEFSQLIRIRLRREEMLRFGLPTLDREGAGNWVNADVVVGEDGLARAIRFVEPE